MAETKPPAWRAPAPAVVLLSGGLDSATALAIARRDGFAPLALSFRYGQRHASEIDAARAVAAAGGVVEHRIIDIDLRVFGGSALTADIAVPKDRPLSAIHAAAASGRGERASGALAAGEGVSGASGKGDGAFGSSGDGGGACGPPGEGERASGSSGGRDRQPGASAAPTDVPVTYVPARNTIFLSYALALAEVRGAADIFIGVNAVDYSGYPDCRPEYIRAFERLAALATRAGVSGRPTRIHAPLIDLSKAEIIRRGLALGVDYGLTRSCYDPDAAGRGCRRCDSCRLRLAAFSEIGIADPAPYA